jgi:Putative transposase DNA-binding domain
LVVSGWSHGRQIAYLTYKLAAEGIILERQSEAYSSKTCCGCGAINKPTGRNYCCRVCGFVCHRDANGVVNQESKALYGSYGRMQPRSVKYRRAFRQETLVFKILIAERLGTDAYSSAVLDRCNAAIVRCRPRVGIPRATHV